MNSGKSPPRRRLPPEAPFVDRVCDSPASVRSDLGIVLETFRRLPPLPSGAENRGWEWTG